MGLVNINIELNGAPEKFSQKSADSSMMIYGRTNTLMLGMKEIIQGVTPQSEGGCPSNKYMPGNLRAAIKTMIIDNGGMIYIDKEQAPYVDWAIKRGPVKAVKALHYCIGGKDIFRKSVGPVDKPDFFAIGYNKSLTEVDTETQAIGEWYVE